MKAPTVQIIDSGKFVENGVVVRAQDFERIIYDLQNKKLLIQELTNNRNPL